MPKNTVEKAGQTPNPPDNTAKKTYDRDFLLSFREAYRDAPARMAYVPGITTPGVQEFEPGAGSKKLR